MTFADLMAMKRVSDPQVSPSGKWVLFSVTDVSLEKNTKVNHLWVVSLNGGDDERQVTFGSGESFGRFSPDGKWVSMTVGEDVFLASWDEAGKVGEPKQLTHVSGGGADGAVWSPDSRRLMFTASVYPECSVKAGANSMDPTHRDGAAMNGAPGPGGSNYGDSSATPQNDTSIGGVPVSGTRVVAAWKNAVAAAWVEEDACDKAKDGAVAKSPVKGQVWEGLLYRHWEHFTGAKRTHILMVDVDGGGTRDVTPASAVGDAETPTFSLGGPLGYAWAPDSKEIAYVTNLDAVPAASTNNDVFTLRLDEPGAKAVKVSTSPGSDDEPEYSPDGKWLAWRSQARNGFESDKFRLMVMDREKKTIKQLMPKFDGWVDEFAWSPNSQRLYFSSAIKGEQMPFFVPVTDGPTAEVLPEEGEYGELKITPDGHTMIGSIARMNEPAEVAFIAIDDDSNSGHERCSTPFCEGLDRADLTLKSTTHVNEPILQGLRLAPPEQFWFTGAEGTKVEGFLLKPPNFDPAKKYPVKFLMHGGPQTAWGDAWSYRWNWELMAASGYVVVGINRRGSTGYGQKFVDEVSGDWGGRAYEDLMKGLDYAEAKFPFIDKNRECALGASYGGYMADWVLTHTNRFKCIVTHDGMYDPVSAYGDTEELWFNEWEFRRPEDFPKGWDGFSGRYNPLGRRSDPTHRDTPAMNGAPAYVREGHAAEPWRYQNLAADQDPFRRWSPMRFIANAKTPTLVIHSQKDYRLDVSQGFELFTALQRRGVPSKMLYFPDEGHWVLKPQNGQLWNQVAGDWCDRWTKTGKYAEGR